MWQSLTISAYWVFYLILEFHFLTMSYLSPLFKAAPTVHRLDKNLISHEPQREHKPTPLQASFIRFSVSCHMWSGCESITRCLRAAAANRCPGSHLHLHHLALWDRGVEVSSARLSADCIISGIIKGLCYVPTRGEAELSCGSEAWRSGGTQGG